MGATGRPPPSSRAPMAAWDRGRGPTGRRGRRWGGRCAPSPPSRWRACTAKAIARRLPRRPAHPRRGPQPPPLARRLGGLPSRGAWRTVVGLRRTSAAASTASGRARTARSRRRSTSASGRGPGRSSGGARRGPGGLPAPPRTAARGAPQQGTLFGHDEAWPQDNETAEGQVRDRLAALRDATPADARAAIVALEVAHAPRRGSVWSALDTRPSRRALEPLPPWRARPSGRPWGPPSGDRCRLRRRGLAGRCGGHGCARRRGGCGRSGGRQRCGSGTLPPLVGGGRAGPQRAVATAGPGGGYAPAPPPAAEPGNLSPLLRRPPPRCGQQLAAALAARGLACETGWRLAALPTVTPTANGGLADRRQLPGREWAGGRPPGERQPPHRRGVSARRSPTPAPTPPGR